LLSRDLLFDSLMRDFSDQLIKPSFTPIKWQKNAHARVLAFQPHFIKLYWKEIEADNMAWIAANKKSIERLETIIVPQLESAYETKLPDSKVIIDLTCYATWAGAYSFSDSFCHVILSSSHSANKGDLGVEVVFHETSHFLVDKLNLRIAELTKGKNIKGAFNLWHNVLFYTTGYLLVKQFTNEGKTFTPYHRVMKFEDKFPDFKTTVELCRRYWDAHLEGRQSMDQAITQMLASLPE
jgi:hypothetical protein